MFVGWKGVEGGRRERVRPSLPWLLGCHSTETATSLEELNPHCCHLSDSLLSSDLGNPVPTPYPHQTRLSLTGAKEHGPGHLYLAAAQINTYPSETHKTQPHGGSSANSPCHCLCAAVLRYILPLVSG